MGFDSLCTVKHGVSLAEISWMKVGGKAETVFYPKTATEFVSLLKELSVSKTPFRVIGNASNIIFSDEGFGGVLVSTLKLNEISVTETGFKADCGALLSACSGFAARNGFKGFEFAFGIPGTVGGAVYMNAGAYGGEIKDCLKEVICFNAESAELTVLSAEKLELAYRTSIFHKNKNLYIISAEFTLEKGDRESVHALMRENMNKRKAKQPLEFPSCGSTFKRPEGHFAGALIEQAGLKGFAVGGAQVSEKHAGFVINRGGATCADLKVLISEVRRRVYENSGVWLETEVEFCE